MSKTSITYNEWQEALRESHEIDDAQMQIPPGYKSNREIAEELGRSFATTQRITKKWVRQGLADVIQIRQRFNKNSSIANYYRLKCRPKKKRKSRS